MIDVTQPPYSCKFDWTGADATATDNYPGLQAAIHDASALTAPGIDLGGSIGDVLQLPKGAGLVSKKLVLPFGVSMRGCGPSYYGTVLKMADNFEPNDHFIDLGDSSTHMAAMGCSITDMILYSRCTNAVAYRSMIFTNNAQDTDPIVGRCRIYAGNRCAVWGEIGYGGASIINLRNLVCHNNGALNGADSPPIVYLKYGNGTLICVDGFEPAGPQGMGPNQIGMYCGGGSFDIRNFHVEQCPTGFWIDLVNPGSTVHFEHGSGGSDVNHLVTICTRASQLGMISMKDVKKNGSTYVVFNGQSGASHVTADILAEQIF